MKGRVLVIAGSDSGGGAGIQADIKAITAMGAFAATAVTALTAQNTLGVHGVMPVPESFLRLQIDCVLDDIGADVIKTGMLGDEAVIGLVAGVLRARGLPAVIDPVMVAKGGARLLAADATEAMRRGLMPLATLLTPNVPEAEVLTGASIEDVEGMIAAGRALLAMGAGAVLMKGGHLPGAVVTDVLVTADGIERFEAARIETRHTHGTGCTLASAIAASLAQGLGLRDALLRARAYLRAAIAKAPGFGAGHGPLDHSAGFGLDDTRPQGVAAA